MKKLLTLLIVVLALGGCASFEKNLNTERLLVQVAVMKTVEAGDDRAERAAKITSIATDAKTLLNTEAVTVDLLKSHVYARLDQLALQPSDRLLATLLVDTVVAELEARVVNGIKVPVPPEQFVYQVNTVLGWVIDATKFYQ